MVKIKDIRERLSKNHGEYLEMKLIIAKRVLALALFCYYLAFLFTIGSFSFSLFSVEILALITFHLYSVLVIVIAWFMFSVIEYIQHIYFPEKSWVRIVGLVLACLFGFFGLIPHLFPYI